MQSLSGRFPVREYFASIQQRHLAVSNGFMVLDAKLTGYTYTKHIACKPPLRAVWLTVSK